MKSTLIALFALQSLLALQSSADTRKLASQPEFGEVRAPLAIELEFMSLGAGINTKVLKSATTFIRDKLNANSISAVTSKNMGREGERILCIELSNYAQAHTAEGKIKKILDSATGRGAPVSYRLKGSCSDVDQE